MLHTHAAVQDSCNTVQEGKAFPDGSEYTHAPFLEHSFPTRSGYGMGVNRSGLSRVQSRAVAHQECSKYREGVTVVKERREAISMVIAIVQGVAIQAESPTCAVSGT